MRTGSKLMMAGCTLVVMAGISFLPYSGDADLKGIIPLDYRLSCRWESEPKAEVGVREADIPLLRATVSAYENIAISRVTNYVNVRGQANTAGAVVGKIYNNCAATILAAVDGEGGKWYQIQSGSVSGFVKAEYFITGAEAEAVARQVGTSFARVSGTGALGLREGPAVDSKVLELLSPEAEYEVIAEENGFAKIAVDTDLVGYVSEEFVSIRVEFKTAVSLSEEQAQSADEARLKLEADEAIKRLAQARSADAGQSAAGMPNSGFNGIIEANPAGNGVKAPESAKAPGISTAQTSAGARIPGTAASDLSSGSGIADPSAGLTTGPAGQGATPVTTAARSAVVAYAKQFLGNPYVYGGTSLTNGADCSGFTQGVFAHFGIETGRSSRDQAAKGREIAASSAQPGDLLFYASGGDINHVALYIGDGKIIHAGTSNTGITISPADYRTPCRAVSLLD